MSFLTGKTDALPQQPQKPLGADPFRAATNEQARPVPYVAGKRRLSLTWISDHFADIANPIYQTIGKQRTKQGYNYFSSAAGVVCIGPVDALYNIYLNGENVYASSVRITIVSLTLAGATATATTAAAHTLITGDSIEIEGADQVEYNGTATVTVTGPTTFTYAVVGAPVSPATGTITARLVLDPVFRDIDNPDYIDVLIPDYGTMRVYWGTETQEKDAHLNTSGVAHPHYRGLCYVVFNQLFLGFNQTNFPNVELVVGRWPKPESEWHALGDIEGECNPVAFIADILQHPRCSFRVPDSLLNTTELLATAAQLADEGLSFSPLVTRQMDMREVFTRALEYIDGFTTIDDQGRLGIQLARSAVDDLPVITDAQITKPAAFNPEDWSVVKTGINIKFTNGEIGYIPDSRQWRDPGALRIRGERDVETIDREWFTRPAVALAFAKSLGRTRALPAVPGRATLRMTGTLFDDLAPGALFLFNLSNRSTSNLVFRVDERSVNNPATPEFEITFKLDRSYLFEPIV